MADIIDRPMHLESFGYELKNRIGIHAVFGNFG